MKDQLRDQNATNKPLFFGTLDIATWYMFCASSAAALLLPAGRLDEGLDVLCKASSKDVRFGENHCNARWDTGERFGKGR